MIPSQPLPIDPCWSSPDEYVESLLSFVTSSTLFRNLCGGVHVLDFLTRKPDLHTWVLPEEWRTWFDLITVDDLLDFLLRGDLHQFQSHPLDDGDNQNDKTTWRGFPGPPASLVKYVETIRIHSLQRSHRPVSEHLTPLPRHIAVGMKPKKVHEVTNFAAYVDKLSSYVSGETDRPPAIIDFGSGQNYLGRTLACPPYNRHVFAIEQRHHNVKEAQNMDVMARLATKQKIMRNKKEYKKQLAMMNGVQTPPPESADRDESPLVPVMDVKPPQLVPGTESAESPLDSDAGSISYIEKQLDNGFLEDVLPQSNQAVKTHPSLDKPCTNESHKSPSSIVVSIHSCGNLTHHGLRSIALNPSVRAVAMIGCCYNLVTERLGPATYKHPQLRPNHPRLVVTSSTFDPHGFPMSRKLENFHYDVPTSTLIAPDPSSPNITTTSTTKNPPPQPTDKSNPTAALTPPQKETGVRLNITARMMAVQAPYNWTTLESHAFFKRHFYRALLQKILLDHSVVKQPLPSSESALSIEAAGNSLTGKDTHGTPLIIGTLPKAAFLNFSTYVTAALHKLHSDPVDGDRIKSLTNPLLSDPNIIQKYEEQYRAAEKNLAVLWSLMAFSASVVESVIVVDRWLWLREQDVVETCWVEAVFGYGLSPRNLVVVGIKKRDID